MKSLAQGHTASEWPSAGVKLESASLHSSFHCTSCLKEQGGDGAKACIPPSRVP